MTHFRGATLIATLCLAGAIGLAPTVARAVRAEPSTDSSAALRRGGAQAAPPATRPAPASAPQGPIAVEQHAQSGIEVALIDVRRTSGDTVTVKWEYRNRESKPQDLDSLWRYAIAERAYLIDPANKKKYMVVRDAENAPLGSDHRNKTIPAGKSVASWAKFPAPPAGVATITVSIPDVVPFEDVVVK